MGIIYNYHKLSFESLLVKGHSFTNHEKNLQDLAIQAFKVEIGFTLVIMNEILQYTKNPSLRPKGRQSKSENIHTYTTFGKGNEASNTLDSFKSKIKWWVVFTKLSL